MNTEKNDLWRPKPGVLVQIWDYTSGHGMDEEHINGHGKVGYVVKQSQICDTDPVFEVICFGETTTRHEVWYGWLREIKKSSDIKKVN